MSVTTRDAATLMLIRDARDGDGGPAIEVCMLRRNLESEFVAGAYVFPGGSVDAEDRGPEAAARCRGLTDAEASARLGMDSGGLALWVAALRECFEEAGVLVARPAAGAATGDGVGDLLDTTDPAVATRFAAWRDAVNGGSARFLDMCRSEDLELALGDIHFVSHWITPELAPRRYDTRFFITAAPPGQVASHDDGETIAAIWIRPTEALAREAAGEIDLLPPTITNLATIEPYRTTGEVMAWARAVTDVVTVLPIVLMEGDRVVILRPGDEGYEQALADRLATGPDPDGTLARQARALWGPKRNPAGEPGLIG
jgi:8-oxo-dGTP pyrophosphatase MutT (NUDIX family)